MALAPVTLDFMAFRPDIGFVELRCLANGAEHYHLAREMTVSSAWGCLLIYDDAQKLVFQNSCLRTGITYKVVQVSAGAALAAHQSALHPALAAPTRAKTGAHYVSQQQSASGQPTSLRQQATFGRSGVRGSWHHYSGQHFSSGKQNTSASHGHQTGEQQRATGQQDISARRWTASGNRGRNEISH